MDMETLSYKTALVSKYPTCDFCGSIAHFDGKTACGPWASMCDYCFQIHGLGLGIGVGQRLITLDAVTHHENTLPASLGYIMIHNPSIHYIAGSGNHGYLYDYCQAHDTFEGAVQDLVVLHNLGAARERRLRNDRYLELVPTFAEESFGAEYCEVNTCECSNKEAHNDT